jgi:hypothetical protein
MNRQMLEAFRDELFAKLAKAPSQYEKMDRAAWIQTAKDLPILLAATGLGYGIGRTATEYIGDRVAHGMVQGAPKPGWVKHLPLLMAGMSNAGAYALGRSRTGLQERRTAASERAKQSGVEPAPQSRRIPPRGPNAPWRYDPRPAGWY